MDIIGTLIDRNVCEVAQKILMMLYIDSLQACRLVNRQWRDFIKEWIYETRKGKKHLSYISNYFTGGEPRIYSIDYVDEMFCFHDSFDIDDKIMVVGLSQVGQGGAKVIDLDTKKIIHHFNTFEENQTKSPIWDVKITDSFIILLYGYEGDYWYQVWRKSDFSICSSFRSMFLPNQDTMRITAADFEGKLCLGLDETDTLTGGEIISGLTYRDELISLRDFNHLSRERLDGRIKFVGKKIAVTFDGKLDEHHHIQIVVNVYNIENQSAQIIQKFRPRNVGFDCWSFSYPHLGLLEKSGKRVHLYDLFNGENVRTVETTEVSADVVMWRVHKTSRFLLSQNTIVISSVSQENGSHVDYHFYNIDPKLDFEAVPRNFVRRETVKKHGVFKINKSLLIQDNNDDEFTFFDFSPS